MPFAKTLKIIAGVAIAAAGIYFFLKGINIRDLVTELRALSIGSIVLSSLLAILTLYLRALRWSVILPETDGASKNNLFSIVSIGFMINNILPARLGEIARAFILWRRNKFPAAVSIGTLVLERIIDTLVFLVFFIIPIWLLPQLSVARLYAWISLGIIIGTFLTLIFYMRFKAFSAAVGKKLIALLPVRFQSRLIHICKDLVSTLGWLKSPRRICAVIVLSFLTALCYPAIVLVLAANYTVSIGILGSLFVQAFAAFGAAIPLSPGYVGTLHAVMQQGFALLGTPADLSAALVIAFHAINYIVVTSTGLFFYFKTGLSMKELSGAKETMIEQDQ